MKEFLLTILLGALIFSSTYAQETESSEEQPTYFKHSLGATVTSSSGIGLAYRFRQQKGFGIQASYAPSFQLKGDYKDFSHIIGLTFLYTLYEGTGTNFYLYQGNSGFLSNDTRTYTTDYDPQTGTSTRITETRTDLFINNGLGLGMELLIQERGGFNLQLGISSYDNFRLILPGGGISLFYKL